MPTAESSISTSHPAAPLDTTHISSDSQSSFGSKLSSELSLAGSLPSTVGHGIASAAEDAWSHKARTALEVTTGIALGAAFTLLTKNPNPTVAASTLWAGRAFIGVAALDLGLKVGAPAVNLWNNPANFSQDKAELGQNVGNAIFSYALAFGLGGGGAALGEKYLATSKIGSYLQGFSEQTLTANQIKDLASTSSSGDSDLSKFVKNFVQHSSFDTTDGQLPKSLTIRDLGNGNMLASAKDDVLFSSAAGDGMRFQVRHSMLGLRNKATLTDFIHPDGTSENAQSELSSLFKNDGPGGLKPDPRKIVTATDSYGDEFSGIPNGKITSIKTPRAQFYRVGGADWKINAQPESPLNFRLNELIDSTGKFKKGALAGLGEIMLERAGDIGTGVFTDRFWSHLFDDSSTATTTTTDPVEKK